MKPLTPLLLNGNLEMRAPAVNLAAVGMATLENNRHDAPVLSEIGNILNGRAQILHNVEAYVRDIKYVCYCQKKRKKKTWHVPNWNVIQG